MTTYKRICIKDFSVIDRTNGRDIDFTLKRGQEYITSEVDKDGDVVVFSWLWFHAPVSVFAGEERFT